MNASLLVVTPSANFGESVRKTLEETEIFRVHVVSNKATAVVRADEEDCRLALLDLALGDDWVSEIGQALRSLRPDIHLALLAGDETPSSFDEIRPWTLVRKSFNAAELMQSLNQAPSAAPLPSLPWMNDVSKAAQHLTRLTLESSAQAALITRQNDLWAYAGGLSQPAAQEVAKTVTRNWDAQRGSDLLRFIRLESTRAEHMLYATRLAGDAVLALVFDAETPFSTIRSQATDLITHIGEDRPAAPRPPEPSAGAPLEFGWNETAEEEGSAQTPAISDILTSVPSPDPTGPHPAVDPADTAAQGFKWPRRSESAESSLVDTRSSAPLSNATLFNAQDYLMKDDQTVRSQSTLDEMDVTAPSQARRPATPVAPPIPGELDATRPSLTTDAARQVTLEPVSAGLYHLTYACLLVPRFSSHYLTGDVSDRLSDWLPTICVAFGWRLEFLAVRPEYLQWVVNVQPNTSPGYVMRTTREQTSEKIFHAFPRKAKENPSGDFWAPGYLIMGGSQPHPQQLVRDYIRQIRERQGQESRQSS